MCQWRTNITIFLSLFFSLSESECGGNSPNSSLNNSTSSVGQFGSLWGSEMPLAVMYPDTSLNGDEMMDDSIAEDQSNNISEASNDSNNVLMQTAT